MYRDIEPIVQFRHHSPIHFGIGSILGPNPTRSARRPTLATHHMYHDKVLFTNYHPLKHRFYVGGIRSGLKAVGIGDVDEAEEDRHDNRCGDRAGCLDEAAEGEAAEGNLLCESRDEERK